MDVCSRKGIPEKTMNEWEDSEFRAQSERSYYKNMQAVLERAVST